MAELFPYQRDGAKFLATVKRGLLADEMGLGKSAQAIAAAKEVGAKVVVAICPASLVENWKREFKRFWPDYAGTLCVCSYNKAAEIYAAGRPIDVLILDEAHYLKSKSAKRTQAIFGPKCDGEGGLMSQAAHVFMLTGTPTPNNPSELWPLLRAVMPASIEAPTKTGKLKPMAYWTYVNRYCVTQDTGFGLKILKGKNLAELKTRISPFILRRKKDEVLKDLPPIRFDTLALEGKARWPFAEDKAVAEALAQDGVAGLKALAPHVAQLRRVTGMAKAQAAIDWIKEWFEGGGGKLVVFAHHRTVIDALCAAFDDGPSYVRLDGSCGSDERQRAVDAFQSDRADLFIGQIQAAGTGITLTASCDMLFVEQDWTPGNNLQAAMRINRIGQRNACVVRVAMLAGSIDEDIQRALLRKLTDINKLFS